MDPNNPYDFYEDLHDCGPIRWDNQHQRWQVVGYDYICELLTDARLSSDTSHLLIETTFPRAKRDSIVPLVAYIKQWLFYQDPPEHTACRRELSYDFSKSSISKQRPMLENIVAEVISKLHGDFDFVTAVAGVIPSRMMAAFLNLPQQDAPLYLDWTLILSEFIDTPVRTPHEYEPALKVMAEQERYFSQEKDWILPSMLLATGIETTMSLLASGIHVMAKNPQQWALVKSDPSLLSQAADEVLRYEPSVHRGIRIIKEDFQFHDCQFKKGQTVLLYYAAANRDATRFKNPDQFDIMREQHSNLAFGYGIHYCLGRLLGKLTIQILFEHMIANSIDFSLTNDDIKWHVGTTLRRLQSLPISVPHSH